MPELKGMVTFFLALFFDTLQRVYDMSPIFLFFRRYLIQTSLYFIFLFQSISTVEASINDSIGVISVVNEDEIFDHITPYFILKSDLGEHCEEIWWQISTDESFNFTIPNLESIQDFEETIFLDSLTDTFFNHGQEYFFRVRAKYDEVWSQWSEPFYFLVLKSVYDQDSADTRSLLHTNDGIVTAYQENPYVDPGIWNNLSPYFLPEDHPIRDELDNIFSYKKRVTQSKKTLKKAKFKIIREGKYRHPYVVSHPGIQGYLLKLYTDKQEYNTKGGKFFRRILGAQFVQEAIDEHGYNSLFKVPKKWIYPLPPEPSPSNKKKYHRKDFVLVVEDMDILEKEKNYDMWKSSAITFDKLDAIYTILDELGLYDTIFAFNLPFSKDGKIAFIDTEYYYKWPVRFYRLGYYLSPEMKEYWKLLISNRGPN